MSPSLAEWNIRGRRGDASVWLGLTPGPGYISTMTNLEAAALFALVLSSVLLRCLGLSSLATLAGYASFFLIGWFASRSV